MKAPVDRRARFMRLRVGLLALMVVAGAGAVLRRAFDLQVRQAPELRQMAEEQYLKDIKLAPKRGSIYDRNGAELAVSVDVDSIYANPRRLRGSGLDAAWAASQLSSLLGVDAATLRTRLQSDKHFAWVKRRVTPKESQAVRALGIAGVEVTSEARRFYPNRELAAHVLGFANVDGQGIEGLELRLDQELRGSAELVPAIRDRRGRVVFSQQLLDDRAAQGDDVVLTLDKSIQHYAERELELTVRTFEAKGGSIVVLDAQTAEVLALANFPTFNPNEPASAPPGHHRNRAITDRFEPGSTIKPFTVAGALAAGAVSPRQRIDCEGGAMRVAEYTIHDTHKWDELTPAEILAYSSNIGTAKIGLALGRARLYRTLRDFGFGAATGVGLPGETAGILRHHKRWYEMDAATIAFGQGMSVTALQMAVAMSAIGNRGRLLRPSIVKRVEDAHGETLRESLPYLQRQVVPTHVASLLSDVLTAVTGEGGTGIEAAVDGHLVAGKTGTAQKADYVHGGYAEGKWLSSFVGFVPARRPRLVISVTIDEPMIAHHGGTVAGPAFRRVAQASLRHLGVLPSAPVQVEVAARSKRADKLAASAEIAAAPAPVPEAPLAPEERAVPDLLGRDVRAALVAAHAAGLTLELEGTGTVVAQSPEAGQRLPAGAPVRVTLAPPAFEPPVEVEPAATAPAAAMPGAPDKTPIASLAPGGRDG